MIRQWVRTAGVVGLLGACRASESDTPMDGGHVTTAGTIAVANLDHQIAQTGAEPGAVDLLLARARFLGDYGALDRAVMLAEGRRDTAVDLLRRARSRSAVHRFADALEDLAAAERAGGSIDEIISLRASILVATGRAPEAIALLQSAMTGDPRFTMRSALASAYAAVGRFAEADSLYAASLRELQTTSPFPYAWVYFARAVMWAEQAGDWIRGAALYERALVHLPQFVLANIHLAEIEAMYGRRGAAIERLERIVAGADEPEAMALLGRLRVSEGDVMLGLRDIARARQRFEVLVGRHPLAFADHAAEFYLGPGANPERALRLAQVNFANRPTDRALALMARAARAREAAATVMSRDHLEARRSIAPR